jgi:hypothetical protein
MEIAVSPQKVLADFELMQKDRGGVTANDRSFILNHSWIKDIISVSELWIPYEEFRKFHYYSKCPIVIGEAVTEIKQNSDKRALEVISEHQKGNTPPILLEAHRGKNFVRDGCKRALSACLQNLPTIEAYITTVE